jgi:Fe-S-cluster containining protein
MTEQFLGEKDLVNFEDKLLLLNNLYQKLPETKCREKCGNWCCSKLKVLCDERGNFVSLPLVYSIEFKNIQNYLLNNFKDEEIKQFTDMKNKSLTCIFRDNENNRCQIYDVEPFSCRVYGHRVPPFFWGIDYPPKMAENIYCKDMEILDYSKEAQFINEYRSYWDTLALLSRDFSLFSKEKREIIKEVTGVDDIKILGWLEYNFLITASLDWFKANFANFWKIHGSLL